ncbi:hypothetical protein EDB85DRAFT_1967467 [Lactarius pseudohatsudake]|nr:hypothetical protein EDB85DRAFT_1967467 [Lactarius pseudohatsudake]
MRWLYCDVLLDLLAATAFVLRFVPSRASDSLLQDTFRAPPESSTSTHRGWNLPPNPNSTYHLIFNSVSGLLQRWPNTSFPTLGRAASAR